MKGGKKDATIRVNVKKKGEWPLGPRAAGGVGRGRYYTAAQEL